MKDNIWQLQEAKSKFSQLVESALSNEPQFVTKHGNNAVVVLSYTEYKNIIRPDTDLVSYLRDSPIMGVELDISRSGESPRDIDL